MQNHYNLIYREEEREMIPLCRDLGVALIPWSPLARGFLVGNRTSDDVTAGRTPRAKRMTNMPVSSTTGKKTSPWVASASASLPPDAAKAMLKIGYAWLLHQSGLAAPIVGATVRSLISKRR